MRLLGSIHPDVVLAVVTAVWFMVAGFSKMSAVQGGGRRAVATPAWIAMTRRVRGVLEVLLALAVLAVAALNFLDISVPAVGFGLALALSALALWTAVESWVPPLRPVRIILSVLGFALAVFFAGFR